MSDALEWVDLPLGYRRQFYRERIAVAHSVIDGIPSQHCRLSTFVTTAAECGTIACGLGWLAFHPYFNKLGLRFYGMTPAIMVASDGSWKPNPKYVLRSGRPCPMHAAAYLFGNVRAFETLFASRNHGIYDDWLQFRLPCTDDKTLLMYRLKLAYLGAEGFRNWAQDNHQILM